MTDMGPIRTALQLAEQEREGGISPHVSPMADPRDASSLLQRAGFTLLTVDIEDFVYGYPSMFELMEDLRDMGESNAILGRSAHHRAAQFSLALVLANSLP